MARKPSPANDQSQSLTHQSINADIAAFRKSGGRIEVLGNTPLRSKPPTAFHSDASRRKAPSPVQKTKTASR
jgi:hypothetical protein